MTDIFVFIATKTTYDVVLPTQARDQSEFNRRVRGALAGMAGGRTVAGALAFRSKQDAIDNHLLCDGTTITREQFPDLVTYLAGDATALTATLPDYGNQALTVPVLTATQTITDSGTVDTGAPVTTPSGSGQTGGTTGGDTVSGGRPSRLRPGEQEP